MARHYIRKAQAADGQPYVHADDVADWVLSLKWGTDMHKFAADYIAQELRLMGLSDPEGLA